MASLDALKTQVISNGVAKYTQGTSAGAQLTSATSGLPNYAAPTALTSSMDEVRKNNAAQPLKPLAVQEIKSTPVKSVTVPGTSPESTRGSSTATPFVYVFPEDLENVKYFITFKFYAKYNPNAYDAPTEKPTYTIRLPMPSNLVETFNMGYSTQSLGTLAGGIASTGIPNDVYEILKNTDRNSVTKAISTIEGRVAGIKDNTGVENTLLPLARAALKSLDDSLGRSIDYTTGTVLNPYQSLFFEGPELRSHNFSFKLSPNSEKESKTLKEIIDVFKRCMLPERTGLIYKYPDSCIIELSTRVGKMPLYTMYKSMLKNISVNYAPNNTPAFFKDGKSPVEVALELNFTEVLPIARNEIDNQTAKDLVAQQGAVL